MSKLGECFGLRTFDGLQFGVEIEIEGRDLPPVLPNMWRLEDDNSLRGLFPQGRAEYVLKSPMPVQGVKKALDALTAKLSGSTVNMSFRCSTHVHINMTDRTHREICNFITTYYILEPYFDSLVAKHRRGNRFCARLKDAEGIGRVLSQMFNHSLSEWPIFLTDGMRYAALNTASLKTYGTLELRTLEGTVDVAKILGWLSTIETVYNYSVAKNSPEQIMDESLDARLFVNKLFPGTHISSDMVQEINLTRCLMVPSVFSYKSREEVKPAKKEVKEKLGFLDQGQAIQAALELMQVQPVPRPRGVGRQRPPNPFN